MTFTYDWLNLLSSFELPPACCEVTHYPEMSVKENTIDILITNHKGLMIKTQTLNLIIKIKLKKIYFIFCS